MVLKIGHRGVGGYAVGNSLESFEKALSFDIDMIELDVFICKTGEVVAMHDYRIDGTTNGTGYVCDKTFLEIKSLSLRNGQKIPTLEEVLDLVDKKVKVNIELKEGKSVEAVHNIIESYKKEKGWKDDDFLISSFDHYNLLEFSKLNPNVKIGAVIAGIPIGYAECAKKVNAYSLHASKEFINQKLVDSAHELDLKIFVYTINEPEDIDRVKSLGIDGIFSDYPDRI